MEKVAKSTQGKMWRYHTIQEIRGIHKTWQNQITQNHKNRQNLTKTFSTAQAEEIGEILDIFKREDIFRGGGGR